MSHIRDYKVSRERGSSRFWSTDVEKFHTDWYPIFQRFNPDKYGEVKIGFMKRHLLAVLGDNHKILPEEAIEDILEYADDDGNGKISFPEFKDLIIGFNFERKERSVVRRAMYLAAMAVVPKKERTYLSSHTNPPVFMVLISLIEIGVFVYHCIDFYGKDQPVGFNSRQVPIDSVLIYNPYRRYEAWRFVTYMFVHSGFMHIIFNVLVQLLIGIPLEMVHRWWRVLLVYFAGVLAGSLFTSITDPTVYLCGASGGVYALIAAHLASIILNWAEMEFAWLRLLFVGILTGSDVGVAIYDRYFSGNGGASKIGYVAHLAGAMAGLLVGINVLRNLKKTSWEKVLWWISIVTYECLMVGAIVWNAWNPDNHFPPSKY